MREEILRDYWRAVLKAIKELNETSKDQYKILCMIKDRVLIRKEVETIKAENQPIVKAETLPTTEETKMTLQGVTLLHSTDSAILVFKNGYQKWIPKQYLHGYTIDTEKPQDLTLEEEGKWVLNKPWEPYRAYKEGK